MLLLLLQPVEEGTRDLRDWERVVTAGECAGFTLGWAREERGAVAMVEWESWGKEVVGYSRGRFCLFEVEARSAESSDWQAAVLTIVAAVQLRSGEREGRRRSRRLSDGACCCSFVRGRDLLQGRLAELVKLSWSWCSPRGPPCSEEKGGRRREGERRSPTRVSNGQPKFPANWTTSPNDDDDDDDEDRDENFLWSSTEKREQSVLSRRLPGRRAKVNKKHLLIPANPPPSRVHSPAPSLPF